jgi:predicted site-specific integrase-resolvase
MDELIPLEDWAQARYPTKTPSIYTLRRWARDGRIFPQPQKHGRTYYVAKNARYVNDYNDSSFLGAVRGSATA